MWRRNSLLRVWWGIGTGCQKKLEVPIPEASRNLPCLSFRKCSRNLCVLMLTVVCKPFSTRASRLILWMWMRATCAGYRTSVWSHMQALPSWSQLMVRSLLLAYVSLPFIRETDSSSCCAFREEGYRKGMKAFVLRGSHSNHVYLSSYYYVVF